MDKKLGQSYRYVVGEIPSQVMGMTHNVRDLEVGGRVIARCESKDDALIIVRALNMAPLWKALAKQAVSDAEKLMKSVNELHEHVRSMRNELNG